jgi:hypothetical protein
MKSLLRSAPLLSLLLLGSCAGGWQDEDKIAFMETCKTGEIRHFISDEQARSFCDCRLQKFMSHYKSFNEVLENRDSAAIEAEMKDCDAVSGL